MVGKQAILRVSKKKKINVSRRKKQMIIKLIFLLCMIKVSEKMFLKLEIIKRKQIFFSVHF